jgi:C-terminal peptidase prc
VTDVRVANAVTENQLLFLEAWRAVDKAYVDKTFNGVSWFKYREQTVKNTPMPSREDAYEAIKAMLKKLDDPFTRFLEPDQYAAVSENTMNANVSGIGVELTIDSDLSVKVVTPTIDAPAYVAGIKPLDKILEIDATDVTGLSLYEVAELLRGPQGSDVLLKIEPSATPGKTKNLSVTRKQYAVVPVKSDLCTSKSGGDSIGVVKLQTFNSLSAAKTKEALSDLAAKGANSFVLDLRDDSGGLFPGALDIASQLMKKGLIVQIADAEGVRDTFEVNGKPLENVYDKKLSVIVNKGTASASEVLTAALRDNNRATVFGDEPTYGKGLIQTIVPLSDGSAVNVTVAKYQTPLGTDINKVGIAPDKKLPVGKDGQIMPAKLDKIPTTNDADTSAISFCEYVSSLEDGTF